MTLTPLLSFALALFVSLCSPRLSHSPSHSSVTHTLSLAVKVSWVIYPQDAALIYPSPTTTNSHNGLSDADSADMKLNRSDLCVELNCSESCLTNSGTLKKVILWWKICVNWCAFFHSCITLSYVNMRDYTVLYILGMGESCPVWADAIACTFTFFYKSFWIQLKYCASWQSCDQSGIQPLF